MPSIEDYKDDVLNDEFDNTRVTLTDENGNDVKFEFLDLIEYDNKEYVVLLPEDEEADEVTILRLIDTGDDETEEYESVDDEELLYTIFEIFKEKFKDEFDFESV